MREYSKQCAALLPLAGGDGGSEGLVGPAGNDGWWGRRERGLGVAEPALGLSLEGSYLTGGFRQQPPAHVAGQDGVGMGERVWGAGLPAWSRTQVGRPVASTCEWPA